MSEDTVKAEAESPENDIVEQDAVEGDVVEQDATEDTEAKSDPLDEKEKKSAKFPALLIVLLVVLGLIGLSIFSSRYSIDKKAVGNQISDIESVLAKQFTSAGSNLSFNYDAMDVKGGLFSKHIVIDNPSFVLKNPDGSQTIITSNALIAEPTSRDGKEILFHAGDNVTLEKNGERYALTSSERLKLKVNNSEEGLRYSVKLPNEVNLRNIATNVRFAAITSAKGTLSGAVGEASSIAFNATDATLFLKQRQLIASLISFENAYSYKAGAMLSDVTVDAKGASFSAPYNLFGALDVAAKASLETASFSEEYGIPSEQNIVIDSLTASNGEINTSLVGTFQFLENEIIPLGNASLKVNGVNALFTTLSRSNLLDVRGEKVLRNVLDKAAKEWKPEEDGVLVEFQREYGGGFYIGDVTFEELVALALRSYFGTAPKAALAATPAPKTAVTIAAPVVDKAITAEKPLKTDVVDAEQVEAEVKQELQKNGVVIGEDAPVAETAITPEPAEAEETKEVVQEPVVEAAKQAEETLDETIIDAPKTEEVVAEAVKIEIPTEVDAVKLEEKASVEGVEAVEETLDSVVPTLDVADESAKVVEDVKAESAEEVKEVEKAVDAAAETETKIEETPSATDAVKSDIEAVTEATIKEAETLENAATELPELQTPELQETPATLAETPQVEKVDEVIGDVNAAIDAAENTNAAANDVLDALPAQ